MGIVLAVLGIIASVISIVTSLMWGWTLWLQISDVMYGGPLDRVGLGLALGGLAWNGWIGAVLMALVVPRLKPAITWAVQAFCAAVGIPVSPMFEQAATAVLDVGTAVATGKVKNVGGAAMQAGQKIMADAMSGKSLDPQQVIQDVLKTLADNGISNDFSSIVLHAADGTTHTLTPPQLTVSTGPALPPAANNPLPLPQPGTVNATVKH